MGKIKIRKGETLNIPIELSQQFDITGQEDLIEKYEDDVMQEIINPIKDYEVAKFIHEPNEYGMNNLYMVMTFKNGENSWIDEYEPQGFTEMELFSFTKNVKNSFFKLDFYDTPNREQQKQQFTKIIPMYLSNLAVYDKDMDGIADYEDGDVDGVNMEGTVSGDTQADIINLSNRLSSIITQSTVGSYIVPNFFSNIFKNNEISDMFIFKDTDTKNVNEFYFTCRFYNAKDGNVVRMLNDPKEDGGVNPREDFYYKMVINREDRTYIILTHNDDSNVYTDRVGHSSENGPIPLIFFEQ